MIAEPYAVYRLYGPADIILYIGCSKNPYARLHSHAHKNRHTWWPYVERREIDWHPNYREAHRAETRQLHLHRPLCNAVIPDDENGSHITITRGIPVRSLWAQAAELPGAGRAFGAVN